MNDLIKDITAKAKSNEQNLLKQIELTKKVIDDYSLNTINTTNIKEMVDAQSAIELEKERINNERKEDLLQYENKLKVTLSV